MAAVALALVQRRPKEETVMRSLFSKARVTFARMFGRGDTLERAKARHRDRAIFRENARHTRAIGTHAPPHHGMFTGGGPGGVY